MKKKHYLTGLIIFVLLLAVWLTVYHYELIPVKKIGVPPVEPDFLPNLTDDSFLELQYYPSPEVLIYDFSIDRTGDSILFGLNTGKATLLDREGRIKWEKTFENDPLQTKITSCGNYIGIGTSGGALFLMREDRNIIWEKELSNPIEHLSLSNTGNWLVSGSGDEDGNYAINFFDLENNLEWEKKTGTLNKLFISTDDKYIVYTEKIHDTCNTVALDLKGNELWTADNTQLKAISGELLAVQDDSGDLIVFDSKKDEKWRKKIGSDYFRAYFNFSGDRLMIFDEDAVNKDNLYYFNFRGELLWQKRISYNACLAFSPDGRSIIYSLGRGAQNQEPFSKLTVANDNGEIKSEFDITVQVEKIITAEKTERVFLAADNGAVYRVDLFSGN